jgi:hypothetical protein
MIPNDRCGGRIGRGGSELRLEVVDRLLEGLPDVLDLALE